MPTATLVDRSFGRPAGHAAVLGDISAEHYWQVVATDLGLYAGDATELGADFAALAQWDPEALVDAVEVAAAYSSQHRAAHRAAERGASVRLQLLLLESPVCALA